MDNSHARTLIELGLLAIAGAVIYSRSQTLRSRLHVVTPPTMDRNGKIRPRPLNYPHRLHVRRA